MERPVAPPRADLMGAPAATQPRTGMLVVATTGQKSPRSNAASPRGSPRGLEERKGVQRSQTVSEKVSPRVSPRPDERRLSQRSHSVTENTKVSPQASPRAAGDEQQQGTQQLSLEQLLPPPFTAPPIPTDRRMSLCQPEEEAPPPPLPSPPPLPVTTDSLPPLPPVDQSPRQSPKQSPRAPAPLRPSADAATSVPIPEPRRLSVQPSSVEQQPPLAVRGLASPAFDRRAPLKQPLARGSPQLAPRTLLSASQPALPTLPSASADMPLVVQSRRPPPPSAAAPPVMAKSQTLEALVSPRPADAADSPPEEVTRPAARGLISPRRDSSRSSRSSMGGRSSMESSRESGTSLVAPTTPQMRGRTRTRTESGDSAELKALGFHRIADEGKSVSSPAFPPFKSGKEAVDTSGWPSCPVEGTVRSVVLSRITDDAGVKACLGAHKLRPIVFSAFDLEDSKTEVFLIRVNLVTDGDLSVANWVVSRSYAQFQEVRKVLVGAPELPSASMFKGRKKEESALGRVAALNAWFSDLMKSAPVLFSTSLSLMRFLDPYDAPTIFGLTILVPLYAGELEMWSGKNKPKKYYYVLKDDLFGFKDGQEQHRISLEWVSIDLVSAAEGDRKFVFSIVNLRKEAAFFAADSTKTVSEWLLKLREAKYMRTTGQLSPSSVSLPSLASSSWSSSTSSFPTLKSEDSFRALVPTRLAESLPKVKTALSRYLDLPHERLPPKGYSVYNPGREEDKPDNLIMGESGNIREATLGKTLEKLVDTATTSPSFVQAFLLVYRYWIKSEELMSWLEQTWAGSGYATAKETSLVHVRVLLVLKLWLRDHFLDDFCCGDDSELLERVIRFLQSAVDPHVVFGAYSTVLQKLMRDTLMLLFMHQQGVVRNPTGAPAPLLPAMVTGAHLELLDLNPLEIARQITLIEFRLYECIPVWELQDQRWNSADKEVLCPAMMALIRRFNQTSSWVQTLICRVSATAPRVALLAQYIATCQHLVELRNFNTTWAIYSGLASSAVKRLTDTWNALPPEATQTWDSLTELVQTGSNFKNYRTALMQNPDAPCLPYLGLYLTDLTFAEEKFPSRIGGRINFTKFNAIASILAEIQRFARKRYSLKPVDYLIDYFSNRLDTVEDDKNFQLSLQIQPRKKE